MNDIRQYWMSNHSSLGSVNHINHLKFRVINSTKNLRKQENKQKDIGTSALGDDYLRASAWSSAQQGDYTQAIALLTELIHRRPQNSIDYNNRGLIYFQSGEMPKALVDYNKALQLNPNLASAYNNRANYHAANEEFAAALADYDRAIDLNPSYVRAQINRGITLRDLELYEEAIDNFEVAMLFGQLEGHIWAQKGRTYHIWGDWNCAIADYHRALAKLPRRDQKNDIFSCPLRVHIENWLKDLLSVENPH